MRSRPTAVWPGDSTDRYRRNNLAAQGVAMLRYRWVLFSSLLLMSVGTTAEAQVRIGPQASLGSDSGLGVGARLTFPLRTGALGIEGVLDSNYYFGGGSGVDSWIDANANVRVPIPLAQDFSTHLGAGVNTSFLSFESGAPSTETKAELGLNLLGTVGLPQSPFSPFGELRVVVGGAEQVVLTGGFSVGGNR